MNVNTSETIWETEDAARQKRVLDDQFFSDALEVNHEPLTPLNYIPYSFGDDCPISAILNRHRLENRRALQRLKNLPLSKSNAELDKELHLETERPGHLTHRHSKTVANQGKSMGTRAYSSLL